MRKGVFDVRLEGMVAYYVGCVVLDGPVSDHIMVTCGLERLYRLWRDGLNVTNSKRLNQRSEREERQNGAIRGELNVRNKDLITIVVTEPKLVTVQTLIKNVPKEAISDTNVLKWYQICEFTIS